MRGADERTGSMFSYVSLEERVPPEHPLRTIRRITDRALERLSRFGTLYIQLGRPSIAPEKLLVEDGEARAFDSFGRFEQFGASQDDRSHAS
jgi:hypothetical protein